MATLSARPYLLWFSLRPGSASRAAVAGRTRPDLARGERVLVNARDTGTGARVVATPRAVYVQDHPTGLWSWRRLGWERVERVDRGVDGHDGIRLVSADATPDVTVRLAEPDRLLRLARDRVASTTLARVPLRIAGRVVGTVTARRPAAGGGEVTWVVRVPPGPDLPPDAVDAAIRDARADLGI